MLKSSTLLFTLALFFATACHEGNKRAATTDTGGEVAQYQQFVAALDQTNVKSVLQAMTEFRRLFNQMGGDSCDAAFLIFEACWQNTANHLTAFIRKDTATYARLVAVDEFGTQAEVTGTALQFNNDIRENGYKVVRGKEGIQVVPDWDYAAPRFTRFTSAAMTVYINEVNREDRLRYRQRVWVRPAPEEMVEEIVWREAFSNRYSSFVLHNQMKEEQRTQLSFLITGRSDSAWFGTACRYLEQKHTGTATCKIVAPYYKAWATNNTTIAAALLDRYYKQGYINSAAL